MDLQVCKILIGNLRNQNGLFLRNAIVSAAVAFMLVGCSSIPDAINPVQWYEAARNAILGNEKEEIVRSGKVSTDETSSDRGKVLHGSQKSFPSLGNVPERPIASDGIKRKIIVDGLVADRDGAKQYSTEVVSRQGESKTVKKLADKSKPSLRIKKTQQIKVASSSNLRKQRGVSSKKSIERLPNKLDPSKLAEKQLNSAGIRKKPPYVKKKTRSSRSGDTLVANRANKTPADVKNIRVSNLFGTWQTVVISGSGIVTLGARDLAFTRDEIASSSISEVRSIGEFDPTNVRQSYQLATILFDNGSARLNSRDKIVLRQVAAHQQKTGGTLRVVGHASARTQNLDPVRHRLVNFAVSSARADAVLKELVRYGTRPANLFVGSVSDSMPRYRESMPYGEAGNRRAEIFLDF